MKLMNLSSGDKRIELAPILYHGSNCTVKVPDLDHCKEDNDFGKAFYVTNDKKKAEMWALLKTDSEGKGKPTVSVYANNFNKLIVKDLGDYSVESWIAVLIKHRGYSGSITRRAAYRFIDLYYPDIFDADIVIGYRADDSYFRITEAFLRNAIGTGNVSSLLHVGRLGYQAAISSLSAFDLPSIIYSDSYTSMSMSLQAARKADSESRRTCHQWIEDIEDGYKPLVGKTFKELI